MNYVYTHGGDVYRTPMEYDFSINVNPLGMPLASIQAAHEGIVLAGRYPDYKAEKLCAAIAQHHNLSPAQILPGNGAAELLYALAQTIGGKACTIAPTFTGYAEAQHAAGGSLQYAWAENLTEFEADKMLEALISQIDKETRLVYLCNPNNPTGTLFSKAQILRLLEKVEAMQAYLCVDECFLPFLEMEEAYSMLPFTKSHTRLLVLRAFTKIYAMAGLRLGYLVCGDAGLQMQIRAKLQPWNTSIPAQLAGIAALQDVEYLAKTRENLKAERAYLVPQIKKLAAQVYEGAGNFLLFRDKPDLKEKMLADGILIRSCEAFAGLDASYFRIGIRSHSENQELLRRWRRKHHERSE